MAFVKITGVALIVIVVLLGAVLYLATTPIVENYIRAYLEDRLANVLGQQISIASFETNIISRIQVRGFVLSAGDNVSERPFLTVANARAEYRLWRVFTAGFFMDSVSVDSLKVSVLRDSTGFRILRPSEEKKREPSRQPLDFRLYFAHLDINNSSLIYDDRTLPLRVSAGAVDATLQKEHGEAYSFRLEAGSLDADYAGSLQQSVSIDSLAVSGSMTGEKVVIDRFDAVFSGLCCTAAGTIDVADSPVSFNGQTKIRGDLESIVPFFSGNLPSWLYPQKGGLEMTVKLSGDTVNPAITVSAVVSDVRFRDTLVQSVSLEGAYNNRMLTLQRINLELFDGHIDGMGSIVVDSLLTHDFSMTLAGIRLDHLWGAVYKDTSPYRGVFSGELKTSGPLKNPRDIAASAHLSMGAVTYQSQQIDDFKTDVAFENDRFNLAFNQSQTELKASVSLIEDEVQGEFQFHTTKPGGLAGLARIFELYGSLDVNGTVSGKIKNPSITADFEGKNIRFHGFPLDELHGRVQYVNGAVVLDEGTFSGALATVDSLTQPFHIPDLHGAVYYNGNIRGQVDDPNGRIVLRFNKPRYRSYNLDSADMLLSVDNKKISVEHSVFIKDSNVLEMTGVFSIPSRNGTFSLAFFEQTPDSTGRQHTPTDGAKASAAIASKRHPSGAMDIDFSFTGSDSVRIDATGAALNVGQITRVYSDSLDVDGILGFNVHFEGSPARPSGNLGFTLKAPRFRQVIMDSLVSNWRIEPDRLLVDTLEMYLNNQKTSAAAEIELKRSDKGYPVITGESVVHGAAEGRNITIQLLKLILPSGMTLTGGSSYNLECHGKVKKPTIRGTFALHDSELRMKPNAPPIQGLNITTALQDSVLVIERAEGAVSGIPFLLTGSVATADWERFRTDAKVQVSGSEVLEGSGTFTTDSIDCRVKVNDFDLALLRAFAPSLPNLGGRANAVLSLAGPLAKPELFGSLRLSAVTFQVPYFDIPVTRGTAAATFDHDTVRLDSLTAMLDKGKVRASGTVMYSMEGISQLALNANFSTIALKRPKNFSLTINTARFSFGKHDSFYDLEGEIDLGESKLTRDFQPKSVIPFFQTVERPAPSPSPFMQHVRMNIMIRGGQKLWVDNNLARLRINANIGVIGVLARPNVTGRISVEEGYVLYLDRKFKINQGIMDFIDPNRLNPLIDFSAVTTLKSYQTLSKKPYDITLTVSGPLDRTVFALTSTPSLDRSDIVALLTVGATREQLTGRTTEGTDVSLSAILKQRAEVLSSQKISGFVSRKVGNLLGLEEISIEGNLFNMKKSSGPQLIASERLNDRMDITYTTAVGHLNEQRIRLDYRLNRFFAVQGETDQKGRAGIDLKYRLRFK